MITQRESVSHKVSIELSERAKQFGILLDDIAIVSLSLMKPFFIIMKFRLNIFCNNGNAVVDGMH